MRLGPEHTVAGADKYCTRPSPREGMFNFGRVRYKDDGIVATRAGERVLLLRNAGLTHRECEVVASLINRWRKNPDED